MKSLSLLAVLVLFSFLSCDDDSVPVTPTALYQPGAGVTDAEGNTYTSIVLTISTGTKSAVSQEWMAENLRATKYADGTDIPASEMEVCNEDSGTIDDLGYLYSWDALMHQSTTAGSQGACPAGWHLPTIEEYNLLINTLGGNTVAGAKMKSTDTTYWDDVSLANDSAGFHAQGTGWSMSGMTFWYKGATMFWTSSEDGSNARVIQLNSNSVGAVNMYGSSKSTLVSCRCIKD